VYRAVLCVAALLLFRPSLSAYSVLTHEAIIDSSWDPSIKPLLLLRYPNATAQDLVDAHGYAYAGCIVQDMGYYPFGSKLFSDLVHYVRSGDFVQNLLRESHDLNEYAFALGALAHYASDTQGHSIAVNRAVAIEYPKLKRKYGDVVTYADKPSAHIKVEFGFDVVQVARGNYAPQSYHDFIGFKVSKELLERAFRDTYSLELGDIFSNVDVALGSYRKAVSSVIPKMTQVAWKMKKDELQKQGVSRQKFVYNLSRASYRKEWDGPYKEPGIGTRIIAFLLRILPKIGPLKALSFKPPTPQTEKFFEDSFNKTMDLYRKLAGDVRTSQLKLENRDFDTGNLTKPNEYRMADEAYAELAAKLADKDPGAVDPKLRANILEFFHDLDLPFATKSDAKKWQKTLAALDRLKTPAAVTK
jgi:hypothetical protein